MVRVLVPRRLNRRLVQTTHGMEKNHWNILGHNQFDYILVRNRFRSGANNHKTRRFPGADIGSDYDLVTMEKDIAVRQICMKAQGFRPARADRWSRKTRLCLFRFCLYTEQACYSSFSGYSGSSSTLNTDSERYIGTQVRDRRAVGNSH